jgi:deazaflavin-dependent oxidoreductase (nitroreductase family)
MDDQVRRALTHGQLIDMTTTGRRSGERRRIEIAMHNFDGRLYISGMPVAARTRAWIHNLETDPHLTVHLKGPVRADLSATARIVTDQDERRVVFSRLAEVWKGQDIETMTKFSPLIEVAVDDLAA